MTCADQQRENTLIHPCTRALGMRREHFDQHKMLGRRRAHCPYSLVQVDLVERSSSQKRSQLRSLSQGKERTHVRGGCRTEVTLKRPHQRSVARVPLQRPPDAEDQTSPRHQYPVHLTQWSLLLLTDGDFLLILNRKCIEILSMEIVLHDPSGHFLFLQQWISSFLREKREPLSGASWKRTRHTAGCSRSSTMRVSSRGRERHMLMEGVPDEHSDYISSNPVPEGFPFHCDLLPSAKENLSTLTSRLNAGVPSFVVYWCGVKWPCTNSNAPLVTDR